jgi:Flp pilus assembly protein TadB
MWLLIEGWLLRNVLALLGWLAAAGAVAAALFGARQAGRNAERVETMRRTVEAQRDQLEAASRRPRDRRELARRMRDGSF